MKRLLKLATLVALLGACTTPQIVPESARPAETPPPRTQPGRATDRRIDHRLGRTRRV